MLFKVLLVDDEPSVIDALKAVIPWNENGYEVSGSAYNGEDALEFIKSRSPDLVITDIKMPVFDGLELIRQAVTEIKSRAHFVILSGYDEFSYVKEAIKYNIKDYILKPIDEGDIIQLLQKLRRQLLDELAASRERDVELKFIASETISRLLNGEKKESLISRAKLFINIPEHETFRISLLEIENFSDWMSDLAGEEVQKRKTVIADCFKSYLGEDHVPYIYDDGLNRLVIFIRDFPPERKHSGNLAEVVRTVLKENHGIPVSIFTSDGHIGVENIEKAFKQALLAREFRFFKGRCCNIQYSGIKDTSINNMITDMFPVESIIENLEANNLHNLTVTINSAFSEFACKYAAPRVVIAHINDLVLGIARLIVAMNGNTEDFIKKERLFSYDLDDVTLDDLRKSAIGICERSCSYIGTLRKRNSDSVINDIVEHIRKNYPSDLSLKKIAANYYMNPVYLGQLFKKITGMYFNDYLNVIRIEEAKKLLRRTNMKIYEVAAKVGYTDSDYFFSRFEKLNHVSPMKYKKSMMAEECSPE